VLPPSRPISGSTNGSRLTASSSNWLQSGLGTNNPITGFVRLTWSFGLRVRYLVGSNYWSALSRDGGLGCARSWAWRAPHALAQPIKRPG
jgi:hypothetical protein